MSSSAWFMAGYGVASLLSVFFVWLIERGRARLEADRQGPKEDA